MRSLLRWLSSSFKRTMRAVLGKISEKGQGSSKFAVKGNIVPATQSIAHPQESSSPFSKSSRYPPDTTMPGESDLRSILQTLTSQPPNSPQIASLLSKAKLALLHLNCLIPTPSTSPQLLSLARSTLEAGALISIRLQDPDAFTRYFQQLQPFYELPASAYPSNEQGQRSKVTGLYLLLLLTKGDYAGFHTLLEGLEVEAQGSGGVEGDRFLQYPVMLEQWLMEGAYDRVWGATKGEGVPSEEFGVFSEVSVTEYAKENISRFMLLPLNLSVLQHGHRLNFFLVQFQ